MQITLKADNSKDLFLIIELAERLGVNVVTNDDKAILKKDKKNNWVFLGAVKLEGKLDKINLRDCRGC